MTDRSGSRGARGVRLNPEHDEKTRAKIQTSQIVNRLNKFIKGDVEMTTSQVTAALGLLRKTMPDLQATQITGEIKATVGREPLSESEWQDKHCKQAANAA